VSLSHHSVIATWHDDSLTRGNFLIFLKKLKKKIKNKKNSKKKINKKIEKNEELTRDTPLTASTLT